MSYMFSVSPDFKTDNLSGWYIFNTWLQKQTGKAIHLEMHNDFQSHWLALGKDEIDLVYANPYSASMLVREKGFLPLVKAADVCGETVIAVSAENPIENVEQLKTGTKIASTICPGVHMMGMLMLEPADLDENNTTIMTEDSFVLVAKQLLNGNADVGFFLAETYDDLSNMLKKQLKLLVRSQINVVHHSLMIGPKLLDKRDEFRKILLEMNDDKKGQGVLDSLGFTGWETVEDEEMEFMIDLMDTLTV
ncbi:MAG: phosphate/phosphite/phosphonate ABC transporter substrate-binding protein [Methylococcales bacterium]|nr:phosphate/phosphite/phosphonate ABC transporter substrate-binding protein [Methylococcales bacterium]